MPDTHTDWFIYPSEYAWGTLDILEGMEIALKNSGSGVITFDTKEILACGLVE
jgi:hypothetical protein